jgi:ABC-type phosphate transport system ATPase subunit
MFSCTVKQIIKVILAKQLLIRNLLKNCDKKFKSKLTVHELSEGKLQRLCVARGIERFACNFVANSKQNIES